MVLSGGVPELLAVALAAMLLAYTCAATLDNRQLLAAIVMLVAAVVIKDLDDPKQGGWDVAIDQLFVLMALAVGRVVWRRERKVEHVARVAGERTQDAIRHERQRIARELHDVIAHGMSVMVVQADAARHGLAPGADETRTALTEIERTGRESLREMRRLLGLLRDANGDTDGTTVEPQAGMRSIEALVHSVRQAGLPVDLQIEGTPKPLPPGIDLAAYRIVQEALTNALRHAGPARAKVEIVYGEREIDLRIEDTGRGKGVTPGQDGNGIIGMRERAYLYGGSFDAAPHSDGFVVSASLPLETP